MMTKHPIQFFFMLGLIFTTSNVRAVDGGWVICPSVGVSALVSPTLKGGAVLCTYRSSSSKEILRKTYVGQSFRSCLQSNSNRYTDRAFCSTTLTQDQLNKTAYKWGRWSGDNTKLRRVKIGSFSQRQGHLTAFGPHLEPYYFPCRVKPKGYALGRVANGKCEYLFGNDVRSTSQFEYLLLTADYGWPMEAPYNRASTIWLDPAFPFDSAATLKLCTTFIRPEPLDMYGIQGYLPGLHNGAACISHSAGKPFIAKDSVGGRLVGLE